MHTAESRQEFIDYITSEATGAPNDLLGEMLREADWAEWMALTVRTIVNSELSKRYPTAPEQLDLFN